MQAVQKTGRKKLIVSGLWTSMCFAFTALHALRDGLEVYGLIDAGGDATVAAHEYGVKRMVQAGVVPLTWMPLVSDWMHDWGNPKVDELKEQVRGRYDAMLAMQTQEAAMRLMRDEELNWGAMPLTAVFETADDPLVVVGAFRDQPLRDLCRALGVEDMSDDPRFADIEAMKANTSVLRGILQEAFRRDTREHWLMKLEDADFLCAPVRTLAEALHDPQTTENDMIWGEGTVRLVGNPMHLSATPGSLRRPPPRLGEQTDEILAGLKFSSEEIAELRAQGVVS